MSCDLVTVNDEQCFSVLKPRWLSGKQLRVRMTLCQWMRTRRAASHFYLPSLDAFAGEAHNVSVRPSTSATTQGFTEQEKWSVYAAITLAQARFYHETTSSNKSTASRTPSPPVVESGITRTRDYFCNSNIHFVLLIVSSNILIT